MLRIGIQKNLILSRRKNIFTIDIFKGLCLALIFHLALFFGLKITSPPNPDAAPLLTPVAVEIDIGPPLSIPLIAQTALLPIDQMAQPKLLELPNTMHVRENSPYQKFKIEQPDFSSIEKIIYEYLQGLEEDD
jgi:hypothetical protein